MSRRAIRMVIGTRSNRGWAQVEDRDGHMPLSQGQDLEERP